MGGCADCADDGELCERGQVVEGEPLAVEERAELVVFDARGDGDVPCGCVEVQHLVQEAQREAGVEAVGDEVERVACADHSHLLL